MGYYRLLNKILWINFDALVKSRISFNSCAAINIKLSL